MNTDKLWEWGVALFSWFFLLSLLLTLKEQWVNDEMMTVNLIMVVVMLVTTSFFIYGFVLATYWIYIQIKDSDIIRTIRSLWWKRR